MMPPLTLSLSLEDTNLVLEALGQLPYARVYRLVDTIAEQARSQVEPAAPGERPGDGPARSAVRSA